VSQRVTLTAHPDALPLGWEVGDRLMGRKREGPYRVGKATPTGKALSKALRALGPGPKEITVTGRFQPSDEETQEELPAFKRVTTVALTLDAESLGTTVHTLVRRFTEGEKARVKGADTPPEVYVTRISIRRAGEPVIYYSDTETGKRVTREKWERSRRSIRARTPKGKRAKAGRYVRRVMYV